MASAEILEEAEEIAEEMVEETEEKIPKKLQFQPSKNKKITDHELKAKQKSLNLSLRAYVDSCVQNGMVNRGYLTVIRYRWKSKKAGRNGLKINDAFIFNQLMIGYSEKENLAKVFEIYSIFAEDSIKPNPHTFAVMLDCVGRLLKNDDCNYSDEDIAEALNRVHKEMKKHNTTFDGIMNKAVFVKNQRENVLTAIRRIEPDYEPYFHCPDILYNNTFVNKLNENVMNISYNPLTSNEICKGSEIMDSKKGFTKEELDAWTQEQILNELNGEVLIKSCLNYPKPTTQVLQYRQRLQEMQRRWREMIIESLNRNIHILRMEEIRSRGNQNLLPYIRSLEIEQYVNIILSEIKRLTEGSESFSPHMVVLYRTLGEKIEMRYHTEQKMKLGVLQKTNEIYENYCDVMMAGKSSDNPRQSWQRLVYQTSHEGASVNFHPQAWPTSVKVAIGKFLYSIIIRDLKLDIQFIKNGKQSNAENSIPAFFTIFRHHGRMIKEELKPHPLLMKLYRMSQQEEITFDVNLVPMVCPPKPYWTWYNGGYLVTKTDLLRLPNNCYQQITLVNDTSLQNLYPVLDALNQQQTVPWRINTEILDIVLDVFRKGGDDNLDIPEQPSNLEPPKAPEKDQKLTNEEKFKYFREKLNHRKKQSEMYSLWCDAHYKLSLANHFRDRPFWLPLNLDFRGRAYTLPPHLTHLGGDLSRSIMRFHQKKKLGVDGLSWLKLHCINLTGLKKRDSIRERLLYAEEVLDEIFDSADNPLDGRRWWTKSEEPWQTLAVCKEITHAIRSGDPENYESTVPVHQDGTCNGLQHYAALGRDKLGAFSVNLSPADRPQDVYSDVLQLVEQTRQKDEENGIEVAKVLRNFIKRKVIKQTVMTTVYGVTKYGARLQIARQLKDVENFPQEWVWASSAYLVNKTFDSIREMFTSTKEIQDWLFETARLISTVCHDNVEWVTPLGLPVVQPYSRTKLRINVKKMDEETITDQTKNPNCMKQRNAFPPNFIHSLDACHMMLTAIYCERMGLTFASVHDCYWTHACTVPEMSRHCREQFVALHSQPILEDLSEFLIRKYSFKKK